MVSVIVPIYNTEKYLSKCIDSIINQTYKEIEIILVDDGSQDRSLEIIKEYQRIDSRIKFTKNKSKGVSSCRNTGLEIAKGDFVLFVDSDDWVDLNLISDCIGVIQENSDLDCVLFSYVKEYPDRSYARHFFDKSIFFDSKNDVNNKIYRRLFGLTNNELNHPESLEYMSTCWGKFYKRTILMDSRFIDIELIGSFEDGLFNIDALRNCELAMYIDKPFYHYRYSDGSLTLKYRNDLHKKWEYLFEIMQKRVKDYNLTSDFQEALNNRISLSVLGIGLNELSNPSHGFIKFVKYMRTYINGVKYSNSIKTLRIKKLPFAWKMLLLCCKARLSFFVAILLMIINFLKSRL